MRTRSLIRVLTTTIGIFAVLAGATLGASAQDASPAATPAGDLERASAYPVSIHQGTCQDWVAQPVGPTIDAVVAGREADATFIGINAQLPALVASADYDGTLAYFTDTPHVVAIHASAEDFGTVVACGQVAGFESDGQLILAIRGEPDTAVSGIAILEDNTTVVDDALDLVDESVDFGDDSIHVIVYIVSGTIEIDEDDES